MSTFMEQWALLLAPNRKNSAGVKLDPLVEGRNPFLADYDRIIFSSSFRRLARKTQVHPLVRNDHIHNRLTHSLEVSCVGRSLGLGVGAALRQRGDLPPDYTPDHLGQIIQAACLAALAASSFSFLAAPLASAAAAFARSFSSCASLICCFFIALSSLRVYGR